MSLPPCATLRTTDGPKKTNRKKDGKKKTKAKPHVSSFFRRLTSLYTILFPHFPFPSIPFPFLSCHAQAFFFFFEYPLVYPFSLAQEKFSS